jgi:hypothetical protein
VKRVVFGPFLAAAVAPVRAGEKESVIGSVAEANGFDPFPSPRVLGDCWTVRSYDEVWAAATYSAKSDHHVRECNQTADYQGKGESWQPVVSILRLSNTAGGLCTNSMRRQQPTPIATAFRRGFQRARQSAASSRQERCTTDHPEMGSTGPGNPALAQIPDAASRGLQRVRRGQRGGPPAASTNAPSRSLLSKVFPQPGLVILLAGATSIDSRGVVMS